MNKYKRITEVIEMQRIVTGDHRECDLLLKGLKACKTSMDWQSLALVVLRPVREGYMGYVRYYKPTPMLRMLAGDFHA